MLARTRGWVLASEMPQKLEDGLSRMAWSPEGSTGSRKGYSGPRCEIRGAVVAFLSLETSPAGRQPSEHLARSSDPGKDTEPPFSSYH